MPRVLIVYSKPNCHLCDEGFAKVLRVAKRHQLEVEKVDIETDPGLEERFRHRIPVVELEGEELGWGRISEAGLDQALSAHGV